MCRVAHFRPTLTAITRAPNAFYIAWDKIARDRDSFTAWIKENVLAGTPADFARHVTRRAANAA